MLCQQQRGEQKRGKGEAKTLTKDENRRKMKRRIIYHEREEKPKSLDK